jgi:DNA polymerase-1
LDWTALEIVAWVTHTRDKVLEDLLNSGIDIHKHLGGRVLNKPASEVSSEERQLLKPGNFNLIYGGTDWNLVEQYGIPKELAKKAYDVFWDTFKASREWFDGVIKEIDANAYSTGDGRLESFYVGLTGRKYFFKNHPDKISSFTAENRIYTPKGFKCSELANYRVQGFATADLHPIAMGILWRKLLPHRDKILMVNTVHDSILFDVKKKYLKKACIFIRDSLYSVKQRLKDRFDIEITVPLGCEFKYGKSWGELEKLEL